MPEWEEIVKRMYDKGLNSFVDEVVEAIYSNDKTMRYVILKKENGCFTYTLEVMLRFDDEDWKYISAQEDALPAMWGSHHGLSSIFDTKEHAIKELMAEPEYKLYFV